jgi:hypothetical protein
VGAFELMSMGPGLSLYTAPNLSSRKRQSIARASFTNAWFMSMDSIKP